MEMRFKYTGGGLTFQFSGQMWEHKLKLNFINTTTTTTMMRFCFFPHGSWKPVYCAVLFYCFYVRLSVIWWLIGETWIYDVTYDHSRSYGFVGSFNARLYITYCCKFSHASCNVYSKSLFYTFKSSLRKGWPCILIFLVPLPY